MRIFFENLFLRVLKDRSWMSAVLLAPLIPLSWLFFLGAQVRKSLLSYLRTQRSVSVPIITVGNVAVGGTGKTSVIAYLIAHLDRCRVGYASSGYRRASRGLYLCRPNEVCDPVRAGDEATLISRRFPHVAIAVAESKWKAVQALEASCDLIIVDDGLQRYDIPMDFSIATVDCRCPDGYRWLLPRGLLREPLRRLADVHAIILTYPASKEQAMKMQEELTLRYCRPTCVLAPRISRYFSPDGNSRFLPSGEVVALFSAIANPEHFRRMMQAQGFCVLDHKTFPDHMPIPHEVLLQYARDVQARCPHAVLVGTEKDWARASWPELPIPLVFTQMDFEAVCGSVDSVLFAISTLVCRKKELYTYQQKTKGVGRVHVL